MQYPSKDLYDDNMDWKEFCVLLSGIMPETPLGQVVSIRSEEDKEILKSFTPSQRQMRDDWRRKQNKDLIDHLSKQQKEAMINEVQQIMKNAFS